MWKEAAEGTSSLLLFSKVNENGIDCERTWDTIPPSLFCVKEHKRQTRGNIHEIRDIIKEMKLTAANGWSLVKEQLDNLFNDNTAFWFFFEQTPTVSGGKIVTGLGFMHIKQAHENFVNPLHGD